MTVVLEPVSREAGELLELAEWDAHLAYDFALKGLVVAHAEDRARYQRILEELGRLSAAAENRHTLIITGETTAGERKSQVGRSVSRFRRLLAELDYAQRRMFEIRTGSANQATDRPSGRAIRTRLGLYTDEVA